MLRVLFCISVGVAALAAPALAAPPSAGGSAQAQPARGYSAPGTYKLIPLPDSKVPAAWVLDTETGQAWLCGPGSDSGQARVTCLQAEMNKPGAAQ
jgi:hypothetical protein